MKIRVTVAEVGKKSAREEPALNSRTLKMLFNSMKRKGDLCMGTNGRIEPRSPDAVLYVCSKPNLKKDRITIEISISPTFGNTSRRNKFINNLKKKQIVFRVLYSMEARYNAPRDRIVVRDVIYRGVNYYTVDEDPYLMRWNREEIWTWKNIKKIFKAQNIRKAWNRFKLQLRNL